MTKKSDSSWFQFDSNVLCAVTHIRKRIFSKLACYVTFPEHIVLRMRIGNLISIIKILLFWRTLCTKLCLNAELKGIERSIPIKDQNNYFCQRPRP